MSLNPPSHATTLFLPALAAALTVALGAPTQAADLSLNRLELLSAVDVGDGDVASGVLQNSGRRLLSADGRYVAWGHGSTALVAGVEDLNGRSDIFLSDGNDGSVTLLSRRFGDPTRTGNEESTFALLSADGRYVAFNSLADDLLPGIGAGNVYLYDRIAGTLQLVSHPAGNPATGAGGELRDISADGRYVLFSSTATGLVPGVTDSASSPDLFLWDRSTGSCQLVTHRHDAPLTTAPTSSSTPYALSELSADGRFAVFMSSSANVVAGNATSETKIFLWDRQSGANVAVSRTPAGVPVQASLPRDMTPDGRFVLFSSGADAALMVPTPPGLPSNPGPC